MKVYVWGTGNIAREYLAKGELRESEIEGFIETHKSRDVFMGKTVFEPDEIREKEYDYILVCVIHSGKEIYNVAKTNKLNLDKIILMDNWVWLDGKDTHGRPMNNYPLCACKELVGNHDVETVFPIYYETYVKRTEEYLKRQIVTLTNGSDEVGKSLLYGEKYHQAQYFNDYCRFRTFELAADEIKQTEVDGCVAEVGVYKGTFSRLINDVFADKRMYLFDTFDSFDKDEFEEEVKEGNCPDDFRRAFCDTNELDVLNSMPYPQNCVVRKGLFPETAKGLEEERFAFVSIDVDFEKSILEALRWFYPRMNSGGMIFVHDYNNKFLFGVKKAVKEYESEIGKRLIKIPLADEGGTLMIVSP